MMSGSDIRDILQIEKPTEPVVRRLKQPVEKRPEGISRELYSLIGGTPSVAFVQPAFRGKFNVKKKALPWVLHPFTNPARADELTLHHWIKANDTKNDDYPFAVLDDGTKEISYTAEEYDQYLKDPDWTKEDTDYLFRLCQQYDLRFPVIEDRYEFGTKKRTVEDLKARYCNVYRQLLKARSTSDNWQSLAQHYQFDKDKEIERKEALNTLFKRTKVEMEEEEALLVESKRIEQNEARLRKEREHVLQSLQLEPSASSSNESFHAVTSPTVAASGHVGVTGSSPAETKKRKKSSGDDATSRKKRSASTTPVSAVEDAVPDKKEKLTPGVYSLSQRRTVIKPAMQAKVLKVLEELGIGARPVMATASVCQNFEQLQSSILNMFELKKVVDKMTLQYKIETGKDHVPKPQEMPKTIGKRGRWKRAPRETA